MSNPICTTNEPTRKLAYHHDYHQCLVYKTFNASKGSAQRPATTWMTFEQTLEVIARTDRLMRGLKQIVYVTGWQYDGHDSKWPAWFEGNQRLKRAEDADAMDSLRWLMREAKQRHGATVSLHLNMCDAYPNSPLWSTYLKEDLIERNADGTLNMGAIWDGEQSYHMSKTREWQSGYAKQRIDRILDLLPLSDAGTVHIDVFYPRHNLAHGITQMGDCQTMIEIIKYWHSRGVDVTKEWFDHEFLGYVPMVWHHNLDELSRIDYSPSVICGGGSAWNQRGNMRQIPNRERTTNVGSPTQGCLYEEAWGRSVDLEPSNVAAPAFSRFVDDLYTRTLVWHFLNQHRALQHVLTSDRYEVHFGDQIVSSVRKAGGYHTITHAGRLMVDGSDVFVPVGWRDQEIIAYSRAGCDRDWELPSQWRGIGRLRVTTLTSDNPETTRDLAVTAGSLRLKLAPGQAVVLQPG